MCPVRAPQPHAREADVKPPERGSCSSRGRLLEREHPPTRSVKKRLGNIGLLVLVIGIFVAGAFILAAPALDQADQHWISCEAYSAKGVSTGTSGRSAVQISTSCGQVWFDHGVDANNAVKIAHEFTPHSKYQFKLGWLSRMYMKFGVPTPDAQAWR